MFVNLKIVDKLSGWSIISGHVYFLHGILQLLMSMASW